MIFLRLYFYGNVILVLLFLDPGNNTTEKSELDYIKYKCYSCRFQKKSRQIKGGKSVNIYEENNVSIFLFSCRYECYEWYEC